jgi:hypothetical protein
MRLKIWEMSEPRGHESRIIEVIQKSMEFANKESSKFGHFYTNALIPALLHTCRESREVALETYTALEIVHEDAESTAALVLGPFFDESSGRSVLRVPSCVRFSTYIDSKADVLYFNPYQMRTKDMPFNFYRYGINDHSSLAAPVSRFLEAVFSSKECPKMLENIAIHAHVLSNTQERPFLQVDIALDLLRTSSLKSIYVVCDEGYSDDEFEDGVATYRGLGQCRISKYSVPQEQTKHSDTIRGGIARVFAHPVRYDPYHADKVFVEEIPKIQSLKIWRQAPRASFQK